jgi:hypothetical protein
LETKRRIFISYHHHADQRAVDTFVRDFSGQLEVFTDHSVERVADSSDVDYLARVCRERIKGTSVTIVMIGRQTGCRRFVDWEILDTLRRQHGLFGLVVHGLDHRSAWVPDRSWDNINTGYAEWYQYPSNGSELKWMISRAYNQNPKLIDNSRSKRRYNSAVQ